ncbi:ATP-binding protein [Prevotella sp. tf2-5]|uniref:ATP-binding protein n=1 Tax=Prevotella sp. tf2-5 TaxID=1761889 RepID=UPI0008E89C7F|nr:ATP-binding protein [Prevotella sp. tf2-5]SFP13773.1 hypothetical protein SAMN04487852_11813 [Prevotella sp. tf2-5]
METKDFEQALPDILKRIGMSDNGYFKTENSAIVRVPEGFDFKGIVEKELEKSGVNIIYVDCKMDDPQSIVAKMNEAGWVGSVWGDDVRKAELHKAEKVISILLLDHFSELEDKGTRMYIESVLKVNNDNHICGKKNIPVILTFSSDEGMRFFYNNTSITIIDENYW